MVRREFSSGGVVYKRSLASFAGKGDLWLVAKTAPSEIFPNPVWRLPKGWIDDAGPGIPGPIASGEVRADESLLQKAAIREVAEEGGVKARIIKKIGTIKYFYKFPGKGNILKFVTFYLMKWVKDLPEGFDGETSEIAWLPFNDAYKTLSFSREKEILNKASEALSYKP